MKYLNVKINLKDITGDEFHQLMMKYHHVPLFDHSHINHFDHGWMIHEYQGFNHVYAYHIKDNVIYDYIFNENDCCVCISIDKNSDDEYIDLLDYFINHHYIDDYDDLYVSHLPFYIDSFNQYNEMDYSIPFVFVDNSFNEEERNLLASLIKGMAVVIYGDDEFNKEFKKHYRLRYNNYILLYNQEHYSLKPFKNETNVQLIERIVSRIRTYSNKRIFSGTYNIQDLYTHHLQIMISETKEEHSRFDYELSQTESSLNEKIKDLEKMNDELMLEMARLTSRIDTLKAKIEACPKRPLLLLGDEKNLYPDEITDMIKHILKEQIRLNRASPEEVEMINEILKDNPTCNERERHLKGLQAILWDNEVNDRILSRLAEYGLSKPDKNNHLKYIFYNDPRYIGLQSKSSSDLNGGRALYRDIRNFMF